MRAKIIYTALTALALILLCTMPGFSQSPDSRICNCRAEPVSDDFMKAATVKISGISSPLVAQSILRPQQEHTVNFTVPKMVSKSHCSSKFTLTIFDDSTNAIILETTSANNSFAYAFKDCRKKYRVTLVSFTSSGGSGDGNCRRSVTFYVMPKCYVQQCNCYSAAVKAGKTPVSGDLNIDGKLICKTPTSAQRSYIFQYSIINKTDCTLKVESVTVHGQTIALPVFNIMPRGRSAVLTEAVITPAAQAAPSSAVTRITVRYSLNGKSCSTSMDIPYQACNG
ncbi:MAG: hypothetical protein QM687_07300 [Ferruginibacter sp.]